MYQILLIAFISCALAMPNQSASSTEAPVEATVNVIKKDCASGIFNPTCLKIGAITLIEKLNAKDELSLRRGSINTLLYHVGTFLDSHSVKLRLLDDTAVDEAKAAIGEGRGRRPGGMGKKGNMGGLMAMAMMMKGKFAREPSAVSHQGKVMYY
ncbi:hypothetical protein ACJJTC_014189 [Scirpophaga incertulas]